MEVKPSITKGDENMSNSKKAQVQKVEAVKEIPVIRTYKDPCLQCSEEQTGKPYSSLKKEERVISVWNATYTDLSLKTPIWKCSKCGREYKRTERTQK